MCRQLQHSIPPTALRVRRPILQAGRAVTDGGTSGSAAAVIDHGLTELEYICQDLKYFFSISNATFDGVKQVQGALPVVLFEFDK